MTEVIAILGILLLIVLLTLLASYNGLMHLRQQVRIAWGNIDAELKRRYELLPDFVNAIRAAGATESVNLSAVVSAKNRAAVAFNPPELAQAESLLSSTIHAAIALAESDPALKANPRFDDIQERLKTCEIKIEQSRRLYNDRVMEYNAAIAGFPYSIAAAAFGFAPQPTFMAAEKI